MIQKVTPFLMFKSGAREAAELYCSLFPDGRMVKGDWPGVAFELGGQRFDAYDGGDYFTFSEATSFMIMCEDQAEVDHYWYGLLQGGGKESDCGWLTDRFGVSWQVTPRVLAELVNDPDPARAERATKAMFTMKRLIVADLIQAADG